MRDTNGGDGAAVLERLAADSRLGLNHAELTNLISKPLEFTGAAREQVSQVVEKVSKLVATAPGADKYRPEPIL
jgi:adenylosuccinate lyase